MRVLQVGYMYLIIFIYEISECVIIGNSFFILGFCILFKLDFYCIREIEMVKFFFF